jgi:hypothetical protein
MSWEEARIDESFSVCPSRKGLQHYFRKSRSLVASGGQVLLTSLDVTCSDDPSFQAYRERNTAQGRYPGEIRFRMSYADLESDWIGWLHVDPDTLALRALEEGWVSETVATESDGNYLARLTRVP